MLKPLVIARCYLFKDSTGGQVERTFFENLPIETFDATIVCSNVEEMTDSPGTRTLVTRENKIYKYFAAAVRRILIPDIMNLPDYVWPAWGKHASKIILNQLNKEQFDYIHSISFPCASHQVALNIKQKTGLPWIAQFYDPWYDNPYRIFKTKYFKKKDSEMEHAVVENADLIIHDNYAIADLWKERYGEEIAKKIIVLPLTLPLPTKQTKNRKHTSSDVLTISHIGNFMLNRTSEVFIKAVDVLLKEHLELKNKLKVNYIGMVTEGEKTLISDLRLDSIFNLLGTISEEECFAYYQESDLFLAVDGVNNINLFFPSKILKYFFYQRPILGITPENSVLDYELKNSGHLSLRNDDVNGIANYLYNAATDYDSLLNFDKDYWKRFSTENVIDLYKKVVTSLLNR